MQFYSLSSNSSQREFCNFYLAITFFFSVKLKRRHSYRLLKGWYPFTTKWITMCLAAGSAQTRGKGDGSLNVGLLVRNPVYISEWAKYALRLIGWKRSHAFRPGLFSLHLAFSCALVHSHSPGGVSANKRSTSGTVFADNSKTPSRCTDPGFDPITLRPTTRRCAQPSTTMPLILCMQLGVEDCSSRLFSRGTRR